MTITVPGAVIGRIDDPRVRESSGLAASIRFPGILWTHNDSGGMPALYAIDSATAKVVAEVKVSGATNYDWEAIAVSQSTDGSPVVYCGDIGDNGHSRSSVRIFQIAEPKELKNQTVPLRKLLKVTWPGGKRYDCESMVAERKPAGRVFLISKEKAPSTGKVVKVPYAGGQSALVGSADREWLTDAALSPDGKMMIARSQDFASVYPNWPDLGGRKDFKWPHQAQGEGLTFSSDGRYIFLSSEGAENLVRVKTSDLPT